MHSFTLDLNTCPMELRRGMSEIKADYPNRFTASSRAQQVVFVPWVDMIHEPPFCFIMRI